MINTRDSKDNSPADEKKHLITKKLIKELIRAIMFNRTERARNLIKKIENMGLNLNTKGYKNDPPLIWAISYSDFFRNLEIASALLDAGADANARGRYDETALIVAAERNNREAVDILLVAGGDPNVQNDKGSTALMTAVTQIVVLGKGHREIVQALLRKADPNIIKEEGQTALSCAMDWKNLPMISLLLAHNAVVPQEYFLRLFMFLYNCDQQNTDVLISLSKLCEQLRTYTEAKGIEEKQSQFSDLLNQAETYRALKYEKELVNLTTRYRNKFFREARKVLPQEIMPNEILEIVAAYDDPLQRLLTDETSNGKLSKSEEHKQDGHVVITRTP